MKSKKIYLSLLLLASSSVFAVDSNNSTANTTSQTQTATQNGQNVQSNKDGEFIAFLITLNKNEVALADLALTKDMNKQDTDYAKMLKKDHTQGLEKTMEVSKKTNIDAVDTDMVKDLQQKGQQELSSLSSLQGVDFEKAYIDAMVSGHQSALDTINQQFKGHISNGKVKALMEKTKARVKQHLEKAKKLQKKLADASTSNENDAHNNASNSHN
ncbi:Predicted outer membrane protein (plasmid) [Legionella adelaidensis]|uniref:Predicted outer membrane protein n=1 Tax=Legionella adelaidensis TaxID=45056 RepID=A0A0W0R3H0_9GAMM|nr:DUF4142 domain-containing protein [Legionella adelaidensis]KTC65591.1 hypothetical protein Lade_0249 [Legionella adelaidensis]VEH85212.1 Predicted outer membrane protein [Legionella adelaidensis]